MTPRDMPMESVKIIAIFLIVFLRVKAESREEFDIEPSNEENLIPLYNSSQEEFDKDPSYEESLTPLSPCVEPCDCFGKSGSPNFLNCSKRRLTEIPPLTDMDYSGIKKVCLAYNRIDVIKHCDLFRRTAWEVEELNLRYNVITTIDPFAFRDLKQLKKLDLSYNRLTSASFDIGFIKGNHKLKSLSLAGNKFPVLDALIWSYSLEILDLRSSDIETISLDAFKYICKLETLILDDNPLVIFPIEVLQPLIYLNYLSVGTDKQFLPSNVHQLEKYSVQKEIMFSSSYKNHSNLSSYKFKFILITLCMLTGIFVGVFVVGIYDFLMKKRTRSIQNNFIATDSSITKESRPTVTAFSTSIESDAPWYKTMLQLLLFRGPNDRKDGNHEHVNPVAINVETAGELQNKDHKERF